MDALTDIEQKLGMMGQEAGIVVLSTSGLSAGCNACTHKGGQSGFEW